MNQTISNICRHVDLTAKCCKKCKDTVLVDTVNNSCPFERQFYLNEQPKCINCKTPLCNSHMGLHMIRCFKCD